MVTSGPGLYKVLEGIRTHPPWGTKQTQMHGSGDVQGSMVAEHSAHFNFFFSGSLRNDQKSCTDA